MDEFFSGLVRLLVSFEVISIADNKFAVLIFAMGCAIIGLLIVVADLSFFLIRGDSLLQLQHSIRNTLVFAFAWAAGAFIIGYIGQMARIFQVSLLACATVGIAWPVVFTKLLDKFRQPSDVQTPTEEE